MDAESSQRAHASDGNHVFENPRSSAIICAALHPNVRHSVSHQLLILEQMSLTKLAQIRAGLFVGKFALLVFSDCLLVGVGFVCQACSVQWLTAILATKVHKGLVR